MSKKPNIFHDGMTRPETYWGQERSEAWFRWWGSYYRRAQERGLGTKSVQAFKEILGRQTTTAQFRYRNWIWYSPEEGWCLYVDKRGPKLHTPYTNQDTVADDAWQAWLKFTARVDKAWPHR